ncbi:MAG: AEC family transporter [Spirochaetaceae bacterium]|jgi:predicted permease|nr:AEC family transporter [Spirochaetaceae bacterium]
MLTMQFLLLCLMGVGVLTEKCRLVDNHSRSALSNLVVNVLLPCNIIASFTGGGTRDFLALGMVLCVSLGIIVLTYILGKFLLFRRYEEGQKKILFYATLISNASFLGNPMAESIYGFRALIYASVYLLPVRIALWTVGLTIFTGAGKNPVKVIFHPCLAATYIGIFIMVSGVTPPELLRHLVFSLGNCTTPFSMLVIGHILAQADPRKMFTKTVLYYSFIRLVFIPLLVLGVVVLLGLDPIAAGVSVVLSGMPAPSTASIMADTYNGDRELASRIIFVSILCSLVTVPALAWLLNRVLQGA